jgi:hypothetical protein
MGVIDSRLTMDLRSSRRVIKITQDREMCQLAINSRLTKQMWTIPAINMTKAKNKRR